MAHRRSGVSHQIVDLSGFPDLVVVSWECVSAACGGWPSSPGRGRQIQAGVAEGPDRLLLHENLVFSLVPPHVGMRQYWRDLDSLERWTRELAHQQWWRDFLRDSAGTGFWHETYFMRGGMEAIYDDVAKPIGLLAFAPPEKARGRCSARAPGSGWANHTWPRCFPRTRSRSSRLIRHYIDERAVADGTDVPLRRRT